jgi:uncharacterized membrane protein
MVDLYVNAVVAIVMLLVVVVVGVAVVVRMAYHSPFPTGGSDQNESDDCTSGDPALPLPTTSTSTTTMMMMMMMMFGDVVVVVVVVVATLWWPCHRLVRKKKPTPMMDKVT